MTHKTLGIVLRTVKYGETSLVVSVFTEKFGLQSYMVNGVRTSKKSGSKAVLLQPASLLEMEVYHHEQKAMHRIKEYNWSFVYKNILSDVVKNSVALLMVELLQKTLKQPEENAELFYFCEDALQQLDKADPAVTANFPLFFALHLSHFYGFRINNAEPAQLQAKELFLDLREGNFTEAEPSHSFYLQKDDALITAELLQIMQPHELELLKLNHHKRRYLLQKYLEYYALHIPEFGQMKTLPVLQEVLG
ncbi:MAG: DNA repair protein RecO [Ferruginibacter sp.]